MSYDTMSAEDDGLERAAQFLEKRADEIEQATGGGPTQNMMSRIFRDEARKIRELKNEQPPKRRRIYEKA